MSGSTRRVTLWFRLLFGLVYATVFPLLLLLIGGDWRWVEGWIFAGWFLALSYSAIIYLFVKDPALLVERYRQPGAADQPGWDRLLVVGLVLGFLLWVILMPLDARRYLWTAGFPLWLQGLGVMALLASFYLILQTFIVNTYLSTLVRIQEDRGHQLITTGVYGIVRHPMYLGALLLFFGVPLLLESLVGLVLSLGLILLVARRIIGEEQLLEEQLEGYKEYRQKIKYRLIPGVW